MWHGERAGSGSLCGARSRGSSAAAPNRAEMQAKVLLRPLPPRLGVLGLWWAHRWRRGGLAGRLLQAERPSAPSRAARRILCRQRGLSGQLVIAELARGWFNGPSGVFTTNPLEGSAAGAGALSSPCRRSGRCSVVARKLSGIYILVAFLFSTALNKTTSGPGKLKVPFHFSFQSHMKIILGVAGGAREEQLEDGETWE